MICLTVATSGPRGSLALAEIGPAGLAWRDQAEWEKKAIHSELATTKLDELLRARGLTLKTLTHLAVSVGPGSFTGIRVGINLARTLAYALNLPITSFNALEVIAAKNLAVGERGLIHLKAVQDYHYAAVYEKHSEGLATHLAPASLTGEELKAHAATCTKVVSEGGFTASDLVQWLCDWPESKAFSSWKDVKPLYIRGSEAEEKLRKGLLKPLP